MNSLLLYLNYASCLTILRFTVLFLVFYTVMQLARSEASQRKTRHRDKKGDPKAFWHCEEELEEACASLETCCRVPREKLTLAHSLRIVERRIEYVARHLDEVLRPPSVMTFAVSNFSYSPMESITSFLWRPSSFSLREASVTWSGSLCHTRDIMPVAGWEGSTSPIQAQPLPGPPVHSRRDRQEKTLVLDQTSAHGLDFNIQQKHLQSQMGAPTLYTESLAKLTPNAPALRSPDRDPRVKFNMRRVPLLSYEAWEELDCHVHPKTLQHEQDLPLCSERPHTILLPPAPQTPREPLLGEQETKQQWELNTVRPKCGVPAKVPKPLRSNASPQHAQEIQEPCVCPPGSVPQKVHWVTASPDAILARLVPTAVVKLQDHVAQKCLETQMKAFPMMVRESYRNALLLRQTALPGPLHPPREPGKHRAAAFPTMGTQPAHPIERHIRHQQLIMPWGLLALDPEPPAKLPHAVPARGAGVEFSEMETDFLLHEVRENLGLHMQWKKLQQEWGLPDPQRKSLWAFRPPVPKLAAPKAEPEIEVVPILAELHFLGKDIKKQLEFHIIKMQVQRRWGLPTRIKDSLRRFTSLSPEERGWLSCPIVTPYLSPFLLRSKKARSIQLPLKAPGKRWLEDVDALPTDRRQQMARYYSWKHPGAAASRGKKNPDHGSTSQKGRQSSSHSTGPPTPVEDITMETHRSDGAAGNQTNPDRCALTSPPPGTAITEKTLAATLHIYRSELREPLTSVSGTKGTEEKLELHMERKVISGEVSRLRAEAQAGEGRADLPRTQRHQVAPEAPGSGQLTRSILDSLIAGQAEHDLQIKHLMKMLSSSHPLAGHVSVYQQCHKAHPGKRKGKKTLEETQVSAQQPGLRDIMIPHGLDGTVNSKLSRDQPPTRVCKKCSKLRRKRPADSAGTDVPRRSHGIPQRWMPGDSSAPSSHNKMPVLWLLPAERSKTQAGMGKKAPSKQQKMVSIATSTTGLSQAVEKATRSPDGSQPKAPRARTPSPSRKKVPVLKRILMCLKQTFSKLQNKVKSRMSKDSRSKTPDAKFTKPPFWKARAAKGVRFPYY